MDARPFWSWEAMLAVFEIPFTLCKDLEAKRRSLLDLQLVLVLNFFWRIVYFMPSLVYFH